MIPFTESMIDFVVFYTAVGSLLLTAAFLLIRLLCRRAGLGFPPAKLKFWKTALAATGGLIVLLGLVFCYLELHSIWQIHSTVGKLKRSTHVEIEYYPDSYEISGSVAGRYLDEESKKRFGVPSKFRVEDVNAIVEFADWMEKASYCREPYAYKPPTMNLTYMEFYDNDKKIGWLALYASDTLQIGGSLYYVGKYADKELLDEVLKLTWQQTLPIYSWGESAMKMLEIGFFLKWDYAESHRSYPTPDRWCDIIRQAIEEEGSDCDELRRALCDEEDKRLCDYAVNPNCDPNSPPDTVLLFETTPGWNKYGGRELMTFDDHAAKGCTVLLNSGDIRFVSPEDANELRWSDE